MSVLILLILEQESLALIELMVMTYCVSIIDFLRDIYNLLNSLLLGGFNAFRKKSSL